MLALQVERPVGVEVSTGADGWKAEAPPRRPLCGDGRLGDRAFQRRVSLKGYGTGGRIGPLTAGRHIRKPTCHPSGLGCRAWTDRFGHACTCPGCRVAGTHEHRTHARLTRRG